MASEVAGLVAVLSEVVLSEVAGLLAKSVPVAVLTPCCPLLDLVVEMDLL